MTLLNDQQPRPRNRRRRPSYPRRVGAEALALVAACSVALMACDPFPGNVSGDMVGPYESGGWGGSAGNEGGGGDGGDAGNAGGFGGEAGNAGGYGGEVESGGYGGDDGEGGAGGPPPQI